MPNIKQTGRVILTAALAASTTLAGPAFAIAGQRDAIRMAQADDQVAPPAADEIPAPPSEAQPEAPPPEPARPEPEPAPASEPPAAPQREAPAAEPEVPAEPARERPPEPEPEPAPAGDATTPTAPPPEAGETEAPARGPAESERPAPERAEPAPTPETAPPPPAPVPAPAPAPAPAPEAPAAQPDAGASPTPPPSGDTPPPAGAAPTPDAGAAAPPPAPPAEAPASQSAPAAAPDASAPTPAPAPTGEVPAAPPGGAAPAAPGASVPPGAPDAPLAVPPAPPVPADQAPAAAPAQSDAAPAAPTPPPAASLRPQPVPADIQNAPVQADAIGQSDARVQTLQQPVEVQPITQERGERIREQPNYDLPPDAKVVRKVGNREILSLGAAAVAGAVAGAAAGYFVRPNDDERLGLDAQERYSERLRGGRTRETIVRPNGVQVVTITNRYGDVVQRSRVMPDGREVVLFYDPYSEDGQRRDYYEDPGRELPPIRVDIPEDRYVVDIEEPDEELYYDTLVAPPVETVERIYSVDEVRRSGRIREKVRRIDLATINFDFASADIAQNQVNKLGDLAEAIKKIVDANPGETFLIEGHTDAVGGDVANLALSDRRAEKVAGALTEFFDVPAENLVTQGYGEQELKVKTQKENRENRRVTVRRITALVKPVETSGR